MIPHKPKPSSHPWRIGGEPTADSSNPYVMTGTRVVKYRNKGGYQWALLGPVDEVITDGWSKTLSGMRTAVREYKQENHL